MERKIITALEYFRFLPALLTCGSNNETNKQNRVVRSNYFNFLYYVEEFRLHR